MKMKKLDESDFKILKTLLADSRTSFTELADICGISVTAVQRRYRRLKKTGIINSENMHLNPVAVGFESVAEVGIITKFADREKALDSLINIPGLQMFNFPDTFETIGKYNIYGLIVGRRLDQLTETVEQIDSHPLVRDVDLLIVADPWTGPWHPENLVVDISKREKPIKRPQESATKFEQIDLDEIDKAIVKMLTLNSRVPFNKIAKKLDVSTATVIRKYKVLREKKVLSLSSISIDLKKLGYKAIFDAFIKVDKRSNLPQVEAQLLEIPNTIFFYKFIGGTYDIRTGTIVADFQDVFRIKKQICSMENIKTCEFYMNDLIYPWPFDLPGHLLLECY
jgi:Lrp/AsnC family transcriptional regulator for asnA, asnC and gidA